MNQKNTLTGQLTADIYNKAINGTDRTAAAILTLDAIANMIAGTNSVAGRKITGWARSLVSSGRLTELDPPRKAFVLGALCHILEVDDLHRASVVHPGCVVVPAILALSDKDSNYQKMLDAVIAGYEAMIRVGMAVGCEHYKIWHNTATCGGFGSSMAGAFMQELDQDQCINALGNAGTQAAGLWEFLKSGAESKHMHAGRAAEAGLVASGLASNGFTGPDTILEGDRGFFAATCSDSDPRQLVIKPLEPWQVHLTSIKPWPSCRHTHPVIECGLKLHSKIKDTREIRDIELSAYVAAIALCDNQHPESLFRAKFSLQHCVAAALSDGVVDFASFEDGKRENLSKLRNLVSVVTDRQLESEYPVNWGARLKVTLQDGSVITHQVDNAKGDPESAMSQDEMITKAKMLMQYGGYEHADRLTDQIIDTQGKPVLHKIIAIIDEVSR